MIEFADVYASYSPEVPILKGVSFRIEDGEFVAFVGTNGAGKSTTMRLMNGLIKPDSGQVLIDGVPTTQIRTSQMARKVGFLFQNPDRQICCATVRDELMFGFKVLRRTGSDAQARVEAVMEEFGFNADDDPFLLNRGARQLLALASISVMELPVVILDEPTTGLDYRECVKVMEAVKRLHLQGTTVVMVCHDMEVVADYAERVIVMHDGRKVDEGPTFEVLRREETLTAAHLIAPQAVDISVRLSARLPRPEGTALAHANTIDELEDAIRELVAGKGGVL